MLRETAIAWFALGVLTKRRYEALIARYGDLDTALAYMSEDLLQQLGLQQATIREALTRLSSLDIARYEKHFQKLGAHLLSIEDEAYPAILRHIGDPPVFLAYTGDLSVLQSTMIGMVGTRRMSEYGRRLAAHFVPAFERAGLVTVSGLALGIDAAVAKETMWAKGKTVACLAHGLGMVYPPAHVKLAEQIVSQGGLLLSEFPLGRPPEPHTFPARNRIIAGLSKATLVLEAPEDSGSIITADLALEYGREVFAVPGSVFDENFRGCHRLIAEGRATLVTCPEDVLRELGMTLPTQAARDLVFENQEEARLYARLTAMPQSITDLVESTGKPVAELNAMLTLMELRGIARHMSGAQWVRA